MFRSSGKIHGSVGGAAVEVWFESGANEFTGEVESEAGVKIGGGEHFENGTLAHFVKSFADVETEDSEWLLPLMGEFDEFLEGVCGFAGLALPPEAQLLFGEGRLEDGRSHRSEPFPEHFLELVRE